MDVVAPLPPESHLARFKLNSFRPGQREVISALLEGQNCLCIMPTGGGKSLCYQLPSVAREGMTLVVSPLIALMKDQVDAMSALGIAATFINSSLTAAEAYQRIEEMAAGRFDLVYIAPERLRSSLFLEKLRETRVQLLAVDEAHCISEWGHDFRPDYARLGRLRQRLNNPQTIALTATATPEVRGDIVAQLQIREPKIFITGFSRPNLHFEVQQIVNEQERDRSLISFLRETPGAGIVYSATRKGCEQLVPTLTATAGRRVDMYHAGLEPDVRRRVQDDFMSGRTPIVVATNAFGMGIDKSDLRFVVHYNLPGTLEAYYQEAGRAGRDGLPSPCLLLYSHRDRRIQEYFIDSSYPDPAIVEQVYDFLREILDDPIELTLDEIRERLNLPIRSEGVSACEKLLENCKALERLNAWQNMAAVRIDSDLPTLVDFLPKEAKVQRRVLQAIERRVGGQRWERVYFNPRQVADAAEIDAAALTRAVHELSKLEAFDYVPPFRGRAVHMLEREKPFEQLGIDFEEQERRKAAEYAKLDRMIHYATTRRCRQLEILDYFGDPSREACGTCDNCVQQHGHRTGEGEAPAQPQPVRNAADRQEPRRPITNDGESDVLNAVRMVLSGVARTKGRFGKQLVARMLIGSKAKDISKFKLNALSTFGLLSKLSEPQAVALIDAMLNARLLQQVEERPHRPLLRLMPRGEEVMKGKAGLEDALALDNQLVLRLRAISIQPQPPKKRNAAEPAAPRDDLDAVNALLAAAEDGLAQLVNEATVPWEQSSHYWTWRVMSAGFSLEECQHIRALDRAAAIEHLLVAARAGAACRLDWILTGEQQVTLASHLSNGSGHTLAAFVSQLPTGISPQEAELFWLVKNRSIP